MFRGDGFYWPTLYIVCQAHPLSECPFRWGILTLSYTCFLVPPRIHFINGISVQLFAGLTVMTHDVRTVKHVS